MEDWVFVKTDGMEHIDQKLSSTIRMYSDDRVLGIYHPQNEETQTVKIYQQSIKLGNCSAIV